MGYKKASATKIISVICAIIFFVAVCVLVFQFITIGNLKAKEKKLQQTLTNLEQQIVDTTNESNYINSSEFLEDYAREHLGWGKDGEVVFK